ncbi:MAG: YceI family protein [Cytophagales bacterium]|nr:YceI family protein [Bernardetiaceae bacterium]MDW8211271.1 YceI family protein [Cytophagales bacterium]
MAATKWIIDPAHSQIEFKVKHLMISTVTGSFGVFSGEAITEGNGFEDAAVFFTAQTASIYTGNAERDNHLRSADFFDAEKYPVITFTSSSMKKTSPNMFELTGTLSMHGISKEITLHAEFLGINKDPWGNVKAAFEVQGKLNRKEFGLNWNAALEAGGVLVGEEVKIIANVQLTRQ